MARLIVLFGLKPGVDRVEYEKWAREVDAPTVKDLESVGGFSLVRVTGMLGSQDPAPYDYCEVIDVSDLEKLGSEMQSEAMQEVLATFQDRYADQSTFPVTELVV
ncbi:MAG: REDY-like protein HapK [Acidimicrobiia bacterium]